MRKYKLMEVCGTHTMAIARFGIKKVVPSNIELVSGPGCPVCVSSQKDIDRAIEIALKKNVITATFGDMMRVPGSRLSLEEIKRKGADIRVVYSPLDALKAAEDNPGKKVVFMGVGFETTAPLVASTILEAEKKKISNFFVLSNFKILFPALEIIAGSVNLKVDGFICPGHVSVITGSEPYEVVARRYKKPCVITGFEAADILKGIKMLMRQIRSGKPAVEIEYKRAVDRKGNVTARKILNRVFEPSDAQWRGLGIIKDSGLCLRKRFRNFDGEKKFKVNIPKTKSVKGCICGDIMQGAKTPADCKIFGKSCTPERPIGPCMVSSEGSCAARYKYGSDK